MQSLNIGAAGGVAVAVPQSDPNWASVTLLIINDNQGDATTIFDDQSNGNLTVTTIGNAQYDTAQAPTGMTSSYLGDGTGDGLRLPVNAGLTLSGDFTIEAFLRLNANNTDGYIIGYDLLIRNVQARFNRSAVVGSMSMYDGTTELISTANGSSWSNVWRHTAYSRTGSSLTYWQDGVKVGDTITNSTTLDFSGVIVGGSGTGDVLDSSVNGWLCSLRITKGVGRYTANFTVPTLPLPTS